jgi:4-hydroxy-tetrahydrodipicolinate reductase
MRLAVFGAGAMGRAVCERAAVEGHTVGAVFRSADAALNPDALAARLAGHDAALDFSTASGVPAHVSACLRARVPLVVGTTGWQETEAAVRRQVEDGDGALLYGANFSVGVNLFYRLVDRAGELFAAGAGFDAFIEEAHHRGKRDAPSGTALALVRTLRPHVGRDVPVASTRAGDIPGIHRVGFDAGADQIVLTHTARSRDGFAAGALLGVKWLKGRVGVYRFADVLDEVLRDARR